MNDQTVFTPPKPLETAVLFLVFNRLDTTMQVFEAIRKARPPRLYLAADGPRDSRPGEAEKVKAVREYVTQNIDWPCEVKTLFRVKNLGCKYAVSGAITWFFENEEQGIILEDDCLPNQSFFWFCEELLIKYKSDNRIGQISGFNPVTNADHSNESYLFSKFGPIWGWASWKRAWNNYDVKMTKWPEIKARGLIDFIVDSKPEKLWRINIFDLAYNGGVNTWDFQWSFCKHINNQLSIIPINNLIINIGFGSEATHTGGELHDKFKITSDLWNLKHSFVIVRNKKFDNAYLKEFVGLSSIAFCKRLMIKYILCFVPEGLISMLRRLSNQIKK